MIVEHNHLIELEELGVLYGRDCIFVDNVVQTGSTLKFKGKINGRLASKIHDNIWIPYELTFKQVIKYSSCELDTFEASRNEAYATCKASFFIIQNSECLKKIPIRYDYKKYDYKHFMVCTYDFIFNVLAVDYKLKHDFNKLEN